MPIVHGGESPVRVSLLENSAVRGGILRVYALKTSQGHLLARGRYGLRDLMYSSVRTWCSYGTIQTRSSQEFSILKTKCAVMISPR